MTESNNTTGEAILIVDDSADNLRVLSTTLSKHGYEVRAAKSGSMALRGAQAAPPDLILLDIRMPEMDGYEVCQRLKANPITHTIPIIFISALDEPLDKLKAFTIGGADYITKPFQVEEVVARVENQLTIQRLKKRLTEYSDQEDRQIQTQQTAIRPESTSTIMASTEPIDPTLDSILLMRVTNELIPPINQLLEHSQVISREPYLSKGQRQKLDEIRQGGVSLLNLVQDLLAQQG